MEGADTRKKIGDEYLHGFGVEIGAGLYVTDYSRVTGRIFIDKRSREEFEAYFRAPPPYELATLEQVRENFQNGVDFVVAHHVIEHCDNPVSVLANEWIPLLSANGILYLSLPSASHVCERDRLVTPTEHILDDYYFDRNSISYESKEHIYSFILQWTKLALDNVWYAKDGITSYVEKTLKQVMREEQDLHWHTYTLEVAIDMVEAAFYVAGVGVTWLFRQEVKEGNGDNLYLVCQRTNEPAAQPGCLIRYKRRLVAALESLT